MRPIPYSKKTAEKRFWANVVKYGPRYRDDRCWTWLGCPDRDGYGEIMDRRVKYRAHVFSWVYHYGSIENGVYVLHRCDNRSCVNPSHLFLGNNLINTADKVTKNRQAKGTDFVSAKLTEETVAWIRRYYVRGHRIYGQRAMARRFNVSQPLIMKIIQRKNWKHVGEGFSALSILSNPVGVG